MSVCASIVDAALSFADVAVSVVDVSALSVVDVVALGGVGVALSVVDVLPLALWTSPPERRGRRREYRERRCIDGSGPWASPL